MKPIYPRLTTLITSLEAIPGARRGDPYPEGDGPGGQLAEEIQRFQEASAVEASNSPVVPAEDDDLTSDQGHQVLQFFGSLMELTQMRLFENSPERMEKSTSACP
jgi:hypothetical protein